MPQAMVAARNISKHFGGVQALREVSLTLNGGEIRCLAGENGSGKSTLIKILAGAERPDGGAVVVGDRPYTHLEPIQAIRAGVQVIYQDLSLFPNLTVAENLALNTEIRRGCLLVNWRRMRGIAAQALERLGCDMDLHARVGELSMADRQLVAIARALLHEARVIIMDEPTTALTRKEVDTLFRIVRDLRDKGLSILFVSHKLREVLEISDAITVLRNGQNVAEGKTADFNHSSLARHMTGRPFRQDSTEPPGQAAFIRLAVTKFSKRGVFADVTFTVRAGAIVGITGLLGSGRRELALALFGLEPADAGQVQMDGRPVQIRTVQEAMQAGVAYVPEDRLTEGLFAEQSIERNVAVSSVAALATRAGWLRPAPWRDFVGRWMKTLNIQAPSARMPVGQLSGGNQQKVVLGRWLATQARVLILNGPTVGIDVGAKRDVHEKIRDLARRGMSVLLISDDLPELAELCSRILLMHRGRIVKELTAGACDEDTLARELGALE
jgi:simple sugar transport system ATP-binding protein